MKPNKLKSQPILASVLVVTILILGFLSVFDSGVYAAPAVNNPNLIGIGSGIPLTNSCSNPCGSPINEFGTIQVGNGFNPHLFAGDGLINVIRCTNQDVSFQNPTDTIGNSWIPIFNLPLGASALGNAPTYGSNNAFQGFLYYTNLVTTASTSFVIHLTLQVGASNNGNCWFELYLVNQGIVLNAHSGGVGTFFTSTNGIFTKLTVLNYQIGGNIFSSVPNTIVFASTWTNGTSTDQPAILGGNNLGEVYNNNPGIGITNNLITATFFGFFNAKTIQDFTFNYVGNPALIPNNRWYGMGLMIAYFVPSNNQPSGCNGLSCGVTGGGTTISKSTFTPTANTTYYYVSNSGNGGIQINNLTTKIQSYTNAVLGKTNDTLQITLYLSSCSVNGEPKQASTTCPYTNYGFFQYDTGITNGAQNQWIHALRNTTITIPPNSLYVWGLISKYAGLTIYNSNNAQPMFNTTEGTFNGATWNPPTYITLQRPNLKSGVIQDLFLEWSGVQTVTTQTITSTSTSVITISSGQTAVTNTATSIQTVTTQLYSRASTATPQNDLQDLETFFPVWVFPILFSPFGIQGVLTGFMMGIVLGALLGIIPLWAAFILSIGILYVMIRRG